MCAASPTHCAKALCGNCFVPKNKTFFGKFHKGLVFNLDLEKECSSSAGFWVYLDKLVASSQLIIDRPRNSSHPLYQEVIYPLDYGYLEGTSAIDGSGIDFWLGEAGTYDLSAVLLTVDLHKRDAEVKLLLGCTEAEIQKILDFQNTNKMRSLLVRRYT
jgi:inorganic pyrophosphatase